MRLQTTRLLLALALLFGCGSGSNGGTTRDSADARPGREVSAFWVEAAAVDLPPLVDADSVPASTCDEDALGQHECIINPGTGVGGGTVVARVQPTLQPEACRFR